MLIASFELCGWIKICIGDMLEEKTYGNGAA